MKERKPDYSLRCKCAQHDRLQRVKTEVYQQNCQPQLLAGHHEPHVRRASDNCKINVTAHPSKIASVFSLLSHVGRHSVHDHIFRWNNLFGYEMFMLFFALFPLVSSSFEITGGDGTFYSAH